MAVALIGIFCLGQQINHLLGRVAHNHLHVPIYLPIAFTMTWLLPIIGISLLFSAFYLLRRKRIAYITSLMYIIGLLFITLVIMHALIISFFLALVAVWLFLTRKLYTAKSDTVSIRQGLLITILLLIVALIYGVLGFHFLARHGFNQSIGVVNSLWYTIATLIDTTPIAPTSRLGDLFLDSLNVVGISALLLSLLSLFKPVRFALYSPIYERMKAEEILRKKSLSPDDYFKLWPHGKHYFFSDDKTTFLAYGLSRRTAVILGDPSGDSAQFDALLARFMDFTHENDWAIASINTTELSNMTYERRGFNKLFIGNEAVINTHEFVASQIKSKHFRYVKNSANTEGLSAEYWEKPSRSQIDQLLPASQAWLQRSNRREYGFFMGYFDAHYLQSGSVIVLKQQQQVVAYINSVPSFMKSSVSIDHIRSIDGLPSVATHYLLMELVIHLKSVGVQTLNLGLAPLSGIEKKLDRTTQDRLLLLVKLLAGRYYSFKGLEQFKGKFRPDWHPSYLYYQASPALLPFVIRDIEQLTNQATRRHLLPSLLR